jgi:hypothetical protein
MWNLVAQRALFESSLALAQTVTATATHIASQQFCRSLSLYSECVRGASQNYAQALSCSRVGITRSWARQLELFTGLAALSRRLPIWRFSPIKWGLQPMCMTGNGLLTWPLTPNFVQGTLLAWTALPWLSHQRPPTWLSGSERIIPDASIPNNAKASYSAYRSPSGHAVTQIHLAESHVPSMISVFDDAPTALARLNPFIAGWQAVATLSHRRFDA